MILLYFAHPGEASEFLKYYRPKPTEFEGLYTTDNLAILIAGEGLDSALLKLSWIFAKYEITKVVNLGIAGSLSPKINVDEIVEVKTSYAYNEISAKFHSYEAQGAKDNKYDCISVPKRVLDTTYLKEISPFAHIVDRELWAIAKSCKFYKVPYQSFKMISDIAGENTHCLDIKNKANYFSENLLEFYLEQQKKVEQELGPAVEFIYPFHMSFYLQRKYEKIVMKLLKTYPHLDMQMLLKKIDLKKIQELKTKEKEKSLKLIQVLGELLNPIDKQIQSKINHIFKEFKENNIEVHLDRNLEKKKFKLSKEINSQKNIDDLVLALKKFNYSEVESFWQGKIDV